MVSELLAKVFEYFIKPGRFIAKFYMFIVIIACTGIIELGTGILSGLVNSWRLERLVTLENSLNSIKGNTKTRELLTIERDQLLKRGIWPTYTVQELFVEPFMSSINSAMSFEDENNVVSNSMSVKRVWWQIFSSGFLWIFIGFLWTVDFIGSTDFSMKSLAGYFTMVLQILVLVVGSTYLFALIPISTLAFRFLINMLLQFWLINTLGILLIKEFKQRQPSRKKSKSDKVTKPVPVIQNSDGNNVNSDLEL